VTRASPTRRSRRSTPQALANGGSLDNAQPGLDFFKKLNDAGKPAAGHRDIGDDRVRDTPITIRWTYNALANRDATAASGGPAIDVTVPTSGRFAGVYVQGISKYARTPTPPSSGTSSSTATRGRTSG
jgi:putative spermidine/putrescine transport system substrate-binding protein